MNETKRSKHQEYAKPKSQNNKKDTKRQKTIDKNVINVEKKIPPKPKMATYALHVYQTAIDRIDDEKK